MLTVNTNKLFGITPFLLSSILIILVISIPALSFLRVPLILGQTFFFYIAVILFGTKLYVDFGSKILFAMLGYLLIQNMYLGEDAIVIIQSIIMNFVLFTITQFASKSSEYYYISGAYKDTSKILLFILPTFAISITAWSDTRLSGLFMNPNITAHMTVMILPFIFLGLKSFKTKALAFVIALIIIVITASRSGLMALFLALGSYIFINYFKKSNFFIITSLVVLTTVVSAFAVDIAVLLISNYLQDSDFHSRLMYTGYNGRDILMEQALERFSHQRWFGLGFDGAKFDVGDGHELGAHNGLIELLLRLGVIGATIFGIFNLYLSFIISKQELPFKAASMMAFVSIFSLSTNSSTFYVFNYLYLYVVLLAYLGYKNRFN
ncbi:O-antigen ligase family protein [Acinetobacter pittii]|uniref:O-antigen ligase family protein n=1 Tax=Acinetobacter pittii TaxID=48296 RepID=UPI001C23AA93|nr:O-antigen ligase family protein [Acinetobacter pittii]QXA07978.1 O-antigen ligase family protein [Acinetobacter pittii]